MLLDASLQLSDAQAVTSTAVSTNTIDLGLNRDLGQGNPLFAIIGVAEAAAAAGAATVDFQIVASANANLSSPTVLMSTGPIAKTELTLGRKPIALRLPSAAINAAPLGARYLGLQYTVASGPLTAGKFSTWMAFDDPGVGKLYNANQSAY
jgi:hypothetical protein